MLDVVKEFRYYRHCNNGKYIIIDFAVIEPKASGVFRKVIYFFFFGGVVQNFKNITTRF